jgi:hypothetical protein
VLGQLRGVQSVAQCWAMTGGGRTNNTYCWSNDSNSFTVGRTTAQSFPATTVLFSVTIGTPAEFLFAKIPCDRDEQNYIISQNKLFISQNKLLHSQNSVFSQNCHFCKQIPKQNYAKMVQFNKNGVITDDWKNFF